MQGTDTDAGTDWGTLLVAYWPFITFLIYLIVPVLRAFFAGHSHKWAITFMALVLTYDEFGYLLEGQHRDWPMIAWAILYVWAFVDLEKIMTRARPPI